jgi:hypothetical protein
MLSSSDSPPFDLRLLEAFLFFLLPGDDDDADATLLIFGFFVFNDGSFAKLDFLGVFFFILSLSGAETGSSVTFRKEAAGLSPLDCSMFCSELGCLFFTPCEQLF